MNSELSNQDKNQVIESQVNVCFTIQDRAQSKANYEVKTVIDKHGLRVIYVTRLHLIKRTKIVNNQHVSIFTYQSGTSDQQMNVDVTLIRNLSTTPPKKNPKKPQQTTTPP